MNGHLPAHPNTNICVQRHLWEHRCIHCPAVATYLLYSTSQGNTNGSVCCNYLKSYLRPTIRSKCHGMCRTHLHAAWQHKATDSLLVCCYSGHIMHTSVLLLRYITRPHNAYQCVVTMRHHKATYCIPVCCYYMTSHGHILHTSV